MRINDILPLWLLLMPAISGAVLEHDIKRAAACKKDELLIIFEELSIIAKPFCSVYTKSPAVTTLPPALRVFSAVPGEISSACTCLNGGVATTTTSSTSSTSASSASTSILPSSTTSVSSSTSESSSSTITTSISSIVSSIISASSSASSSASATSNATCTVTAYADVPAATASCTNIVLDSLVVPPNSTLDLASLKKGTKVTFAGFTTWQYANANYDLIKVGGTNIEITATPDAILDGNGQAWWDGQGSNGGIAKPNHFITVNKALGSSVIHNLYIQNYPVHCFSISSCSNLTIHDITLNNVAGDAPNAISSGLAAAHNSDGFDISSCNDTTLRDSTVLNQDDCVAITSGNNILVSNMYCSGGHGLSIGSVGGKSNNNVTNIIFTDSKILNSQNGPRIKTNYNTTGYISNITYSNIAVSNISIYGIDIQQDYLNGGPTGIPSNGVIITDINMLNITGTAQPTAKDYYILCGDGSCSDFYFQDVNIVGGTNDSCNVVTGGDFTCP